MAARCSEETGTSKAATTLPSELNCSTRADTPVAGPRRRRAHASSTGSARARGVSDAQPSGAVEGVAARIIAARWVRPIPVRGVRMKPRSGGGTCPVEIASSELAVRA